MADSEMIKWSGHGDVCFFLKANEIRGVKDISISAKLETEDETVDSEKYTKKKNDGGYEITMTAVLNAALGVDVKKVALAMTESARIGNTGYFYMATQKLLTPQFVATDAKIKNLRTNRTGTWLECEVDFTLKQSSKFDGSTEAATDGSSGGGGDDGASSGGSTSRKYKVQIPGMGEVSVWGTSVQSAIRQAAGKNWTGTISVNGKDYSVTKGTINTTSGSSSGSSAASGGNSTNKSSSAKAATTTTTTNAAKTASAATTKSVTNGAAAAKVASAVTKVTNTISNMIKNLVK